MLNMIFAYVAAAVLLAGIFGVAVYRHRSGAVLKGWAERNGFKLVHADPYPATLGPAAWKRSQGQSIYHVTLADKHGRTRRAWVRCGGHFLGTLCDYVEARWEQ